MRSFRATQNLVAVSAALRETAINTEQTLSTSMLVEMTDVADVDPRRENNANELTGKEEPDTVYDLGRKSMLGLTFNKAQPQHFAFILGYGLGSLGSVAAGTGFQHTIVPIANDLDGDRSNPSFTAAMRHGLTVAERRFASMFIDSFVVTVTKDDWIKLSAQCKGTGKMASTITEETVSAAENAASLNLAANAVHGSDAAGRLDNVHRIRVDLTGTGVWTEVAYSAVSTATPAVITITPPGAVVTARNYKILYVPTKPVWATFPSRVEGETPLRVAQLTLTLGGKWSGSAFVGGRPVRAELSSLAWNFANNLEIEFLPGAGDAYASRAFRPSRSQTIALNREFRDYILQNYIEQNETFGLYVLAEGAVYDTPHKYQVELIFPKVGVIKAPLSIDGKKNAEAGDLIVLQDDTYGSVIAKVKNLVAAYAA
jgi:hypothetical protein